MFEDADVPKGRCCCLLGQVAKGDPVQIGDQRKKRRAGERQRKRANQRREMGISETKKERGGEQRVVTQRRDSKHGGGINVFDSRLRGRTSLSRRETCASLDVLVAIASAFSERSSSISWDAAGVSSKGSSGR